MDARAQSATKDGAQILADFSARWFPDKQYDTLGEEVSALLLPRGYEPFDLDGPRPKTGGAFIREAFIRRQETGIDFLVCEDPYASKILNVAEKSKLNYLRFGSPSELDAFKDRYSTTDTFIFEAVRTYQHDANLKRELISVNNSSMKYMIDGIVKGLGIGLLGTIMGIAIARDYHPVNKFGDWFLPTAVLATLVTTGIMGAIIGVYVQRRSSISRENEAVKAQAAYTETMDRYRRAFQDFTDKYRPVTTSGLAALEKALGIEPPGAV